MKTKFFRIDYDEEDGELDKDDVEDALIGCKVHELPPNIFEEEEIDELREDLERVDYAEEKEKKIEPLRYINIPDDKQMLTKDYVMGIIRKINEIINHINKGER